MKKKLSIMLVLVLVLSLISFYVPTNAEEKPTISADDEVGSVGEEITIPVRITGNSKLASFAISVSYDDEGDFFYVDDAGELTCVALSFHDSATVTIEDNNSGTEPKETDNPDKDGKLNNMDVTRLARYLLGY